MALSQADVTALETALASGELTVEYDGKRVTYRSTAELKAALEYVKAQVLPAAERTMQSFAQFTRD